MQERAADVLRWWHLAPCGQAVIDGQGMLRGVNRTLSEWLGESMKALANRPASELFTPEARMVYLGLLAFRVAERGAVDEVHLTLRLVKGNARSVLCSARLLDQEGERQILLSMLPIDRKDRLERELLEARRTTQAALEEKNAVIAELEKLRTRLESQHEALEALTVQLGQQAMSDALTGLPNRRRFEQSLRRLLTDARAGELAGVKENAFSVALLDVDHFKPVNDRHGHAAGDLVLQELATLLTGQLRGRDMAARIGGEEFCLLMLDTSLEDARNALERLRLAIADHDWSIAPITVSLGLTDYRSGDTRDSLMARADAALYAAKREGRNRIAIG